MTDKMRLNKSDLLYFIKHPFDYFVNAKGVVDVWFFSKVYNVGDLVGPYLLEKLCGKKVRKNILGLRPHYLSVGSIFDQVTEESVVWGAGFMRDSDELVCHPSKVLLVRGKLTKNKLPTELNCVMGDPALALGRFYSPKSRLSNKRKVGIVLHYSDEHLKGQFIKQEGVKIIDVKQGVESFVDEISSCSSVFSSSLHGLIISDAYQVPNCWIRFDECQRFDDFKYHDYYSIFSEKDVTVKPLIINAKKTVSLLEQVSSCCTREIKEHVDMIVNSFE